MARTTLKRTEDLLTPKEIKKLAKAYEGYPRGIKSRMARTLLAQSLAIQKAANSLRPVADDQDLLEGVEE
jgi:hypothetical protein